VTRSADAWPMGSVHSRTCAGVWRADTAPTGSRGGLLAWTAVASLSSCSDDWR
jgi:hypothetical protein